jgi:hypothetical protein
MESILIHPESAEQLKTVKAVLKALKVQFEPQSVILPTHILKALKRASNSMNRDNQFLWRNLKKSIF